MLTIAISACAGATTTSTIRMNVPSFRHAIFNETSRISPTPSGRSAGAATARERYAGSAGGEALAQPACVVVLPATTGTCRGELALELDERVDEVTPHRLRAEL